MSVISSPDRWRPVSFLYLFGDKENIVLSQQQKLPVISTVIYSLFDAEYFPFEASDISL